MSITLVDALLLIFCSFALLALLGTLREVTFVRSEFRALSNVLLEPELPPVVGGPIPKAVRQTLDGRFHENGAGSSLHDLVFLSASCGSCRAFVKQLDRRSQSGESDRSLFTIVLPADHRTTELARTIERHDLPLVFDEAHRSAAALAVDMTPTVVTMDLADGTVLSYEVGANAEVVGGRREKVAGGDS